MKPNWKKLIMLIHMTETHKAAHLTSGVGTNSVAGFNPFQNYSLHAVSIDQTTLASLMVVLDFIVLIILPRF